MCGGGNAALRCRCGCPQKRARQDARKHRGIGSQTRDRGNYQEGRERGVTRTHAELERRGKEDKRTFPWTPHERQPCQESTRRIALRKTDSEVRRRHARECISLLVGGGR